jgi:NAD(P)-dependent dehydrogenase (short-subunit alcohol dehydrogenase family)
MNDVSPPLVVLVTGCSSGFGLLTAARLASRGHIVVATMRNLEKKNALLGEVNRRSGKVDILQMDVTDKESISRTVSEIAGRYGRIDVLINNAGYGIGGFFEDLSDEDIRQQMETNFFGVQNVTREVIPLMRSRRRGKIINISSVAGFSASPSFGAYSASKWALEAFSESLRYELKFFGIDVLLVEPGTYKTSVFYENARYARDFDNPQSPYYSFSQHLKKKVMDYVENCRKDPEDVAVLIERLIKARNPSFRNIPDVEGRILCILRRCLPFRAYSWLIRTMFLKGLKVGHDHSGRNAHTVV